VRSIYPAVAIFVMNKRDGPVSPLRSGAAEDALITRPEQDVMVSRLPAGGAVFVLALLEGMPLGMAANSAFEHAPDFDLQAALAQTLTAGVFTTIEMEI